MKVNPVFSTVSMLATLLLWGTCLYAQTFRGATQLRETPKTFGALIYPVVTRPQTIRINFDNPAGGTVRVFIQHESGNIVYDEYKNVVASREHFDLSSLPAGNYVVDLSTRHDHIIKLFTIESAQAGYITMETPTMQVMPEFPTRRRLVVKK